MPINKNALIRYKYLDKLLSDRHHYYTIRDLTEKVNEMMEKDGLDVHVVKRTIEKDLLALQCAPFSAPIDTIKKDGRNIVRYSKDSFSIFNEELSIEERHLLHEVLCVKNITNMGSYLSITNIWKNMDWTPLINMSIANPSLQKRLNKCLIKKRKNISALGENS